MSENFNQQTFALPPDLSAAVEAALDDWDAKDKVRRLWARDASLWTNSDEGKWLGWLSIVDEQQRSIRRFPNFSLEVKDAGFSHVLLLGMGGSSLCPEVMSKSFGKIEGFPELHILDSTDPAQIRTLENKIDPANTLFIVSSKSGSTLEPNIFKQYFFERVRQVVGDDEVGNRFVAITDPGSRLRQEAENDRFRKIFLGVPSIGGRYSALSDFGLAPAAAMGVDVAKFLDRTHEMVKACGADVSARNNPGVILGALLGVAHNQERDKITIVASPGIHDLGAWLEQLLAESTGKNGKGLVPVDREPPTSPEGYGGRYLQAYRIGCAESDFAFGQIATGAVTPAAWWLDVETGNSWSSSDRVLNQAAIDGAADRLKFRSGAAVGVYSYARAWNQITSGPGFAPASASGSWVAGDCTTFSTGLLAWLRQSGNTSSGADADYAC